MPSPRSGSGRLSQFDPNGDSSVCDASSRGCRSLHPIRLRYRTSRRADVNSEPGRGRRGSGGRPRRRWSLPRRGPGTGRRGRAWCGCARSTLERSHQPARIDPSPGRPGRARSLRSAAACAAGGGSATTTTSGWSTSRDTYRDQGPVPDAAPGLPAASRGSLCGPSTRARVSRAVRYRTCPLRIGSLVPLPTLSSWSPVTMLAKPRYR
jgi:hypothetical protein